MITSSGRIPTGVAAPDRDSELGSPDSASDEPSSVHKGPGACSEEHALVTDHLADDPAGDRVDPGRGLVVRVRAVRTVFFGTDQERDVADGPEVRGSGVVRAGTRGRL